MHLIYEHLLTAMWVAFMGYWLIAAVGVKQATRVESPLSKAGHMVPMTIAAILLWVPVLPYGFLDGFLVTPSLWIFWTGVAVTAAGMLFAIWARVHLGRNWSGTVTLKKDHELITSGPYQLVRHPVYTGFLLAFLGCAIARDEWRSVVAMVLVVAALWRKLRLEERWLAEQFGDTYRNYARRVAALIPKLV